MILDNLTLEERTKIVVDKFLATPGMRGLDVVNMEPSTEEWSSIIEMLRERYRAANRSYSGNYMDR